MHKLIVTTVATLALAPAAQAATATFGPSHPQRDLKREQRILRADEHAERVALRQHHTAKAREMAARAKAVTLQIQQLERVNAR